MHRDTNYVVNIRCPHCGRNIQSAVSGFAAVFGVRIKTCSKCQKDFYLNILAVATVQEDVSDGEVAELRQKIKYLKKKKLEDYYKLLSEAAMYEEIYGAALQIAKEMYHKRQMN